MAVDNSILKIIIKECCRSLSFDDERQLYTFPFRPALSDKWKAIRAHIHVVDPTFCTDNFNNVLNRIARLTVLCLEQTLYEVVDADLLPGEILRIKLIKGFVPILTIIKMKHGQYLDISTGRGYSFGDRVIFQSGLVITTSEGEELGMCQSIALLMPTSEHIVMGRVMMGTYYRKCIATSLWPLFNISKTVTYTNAMDLCNKLTSMSREMGLGIMPLLYIINAPMQHGLR